MPTQDVRSFLKGLAKSPEFRRLTSQGGLPIAAADAEATRWALAHLDLDDQQRADLEAARTWAGATWRAREG